MKRTSARMSVCARLIIDQEIRHLFRREGLPIATRRKYDLSFVHCLNIWLTWPICHKTPATLGDIRELVQYVGSLFNNNSRYLEELVTTVKDSVVGGTSNTNPKVLPLPLGPNSRTEERNLLAVSY